MAPVTLTDVAALAGVSQPTASRVLNGSVRTPKPAVAEAVRKAAAELGYVPNAQAQALARSSTGLLGLVVHDIADPYFSEIAAGVQEAATAHNRQMMLTSTLRSVTSEVAAVEQFIAHRTDAIVMVGSRWTTSEAAASAMRLTAGLGSYARNGGRIAVVGQPIADAPAHTVVPENRAGARSLALALIEQGHREFVVLSGPPSLVTAADRTAGFLDGMAENDLRPHGVLPGDFTRDGGFGAARQISSYLRSSGSERVCIFAVNDVMALGAMAALREAGLDVSSEVYVAGFDDIPTLRDHRPGLTTVRLPLHEMGRRAVEMIFSSPSGDHRLEHIAGEVILRDSTALTRSTQTA